MSLLPIHPYLFGVLLGDGTFRHQLALSSADSYIIDKCNDILLRDDYRLQYKSNYDYSIIGVYELNTDKFNTAKGIIYNKYKQTLIDFDLWNKYSHEKFIPEVYLHATFAQRLELIQGLMDTDGTIAKARSIQFCTTSPQLAKDVQYLIRSIGGLCSISIKTPKFVYNGQAKTGKLAYGLNIRYKNQALLFSLPRKVARCQCDNQHANTGLRIKSVELIGQKEAQCISIADSSQLYVTDDFIVTHNTLIAGVLLTSYIFGRFPEKRLVYATYNEERAKDVVQNEILPMIMSDIYAQVFPESKIKWNVEEELDSKVKKKKEATALGFSNVNSNRGGFKAAGRRTMLTGKPAHLLIIDDYFKDDSEAFSPKIRNQVWNWYATTARMRQQTNTIKVVFATRWHSDDLIGRILKENDANRYDSDYMQWELLSFPALKEAHHISNHYDVRQIGEYLDPNKRHLYAEYKTDIRAWKALCQQEPLDEKGLIFQRDYFHQYEQLPEIQQVYISIDTNFTKTAKHGDDCGITVWGTNNHRYYLLDFYNAKYNFIELKNKVVDLIKIYPNYAGILVELKANGAALVDELNQYFPRVYGIDPENKSKLQRAQYVLDEFVNNRVFVPTKQLQPRIDFYIEQLCQFTGQKDGVDDLVDSTTMFLGYIKHTIIRIPSLDSLNKLAIPNLANKLFGNPRIGKMNAAVTTSGFGRRRLW